MTTKAALGNTTSAEHRHTHAQIPHLDSKHHTTHIPVAPYSYHIHTSMPFHLYLILFCCVCVSIPAVEVVKNDDGTTDLLVNDQSEAAQHLNNLSQIPISITFNLYPPLPSSSVSAASPPSSSALPLYLIDATIAEQYSASASCSIAVNDHGEICGMSEFQGRSIERCITERTCDQ